MSCAFSCVVGQMAAEQVWAVWAFGLHDHRVSGWQGPEVDQPGRPLGPLVGIAMGFAVVVVACVWLPSIVGFLLLAVGLLLYAIGLR
jgi:hypothetical protein